MTTKTSPPSRSRTLPIVRRRVRSVRFLVRLARGHAASLFNRGFREAAVGLYEAAARALLAPERGLPASSRRHLVSALQDARHLQTPAARAWRLSNALDLVADALAPRPAPALVRPAPARMHGRSAQRP